MKVYKHTNYDEYVRIQKNHVKNHINKVKQKIDIKNINLDDCDNIGWVKKRDLDRVYFKISEYIDIKNIANMICHGVRCGYESKYFMDKLGANKVYSTDLEDVFLFDKKNFYKQDFDLLPDNWISKFDVVYSNAIDHSRHPKTTLKNWVLQLKDGGIMLVTFSLGEKVTNCDCFAIRNVDEIHSLIKDLGIRALYCSDVYRKNVVDVYFKKGAR